MILETTTVLRVGAGFDRRGQEEVEGAAAGGDEASVRSDTVGPVGLSRRDGAGGGHQGPPIRMYRGVKIDRAHNSESCRKCQPTRCLAGLSRWTQRPRSSEPGVHCLLIGYPIRIPPAPTGKAVAQRPQHHQDFGKFDMWILGRNLYAYNSLVLALEIELGQFEASLNMLHQRGVQEGRNRNCRQRLWYDFFVFSI